MSHFYQPDDETWEGRMDSYIEEAEKQITTLRAEVERLERRDAIITSAYTGQVQETERLRNLAIEGWDKVEDLRAQLSARDAEVEEERQRVRFLEAERANCDADYAELEAKLSALDVDLRALREVLQHIRSERRKLTRVFLNTLYRTFGLLDQDNNPTPLLTGKPGPGGEG